MDSKTTSSAAIKKLLLVLLLALAILSQQVAASRFFSGDSLAYGSGSWPAKSFGRQQQQFPLNDNEIEFIKTLRSAAGMSAARHRNSRLLSAQTTSSRLNNNEPDANNQPINHNNNNNLRLSRLQRSLDGGASAAPMQFPAQQQLKQHLQIYQDEQAFRRQLPDLIAQARTDKALERALLRMLINSSLSAAATAFSQQQQQQQQQAGSSPMDSSLAGSAASINSNTDAANDANLSSSSSNSKQQQVILENLANLDPIANELAGGISRGLLSPSVSSTSSSTNEQEGFLTSIAGGSVDKRESKPCLFNAIDCLRNPYGRNTEI